MAISDFKVGEGQYTLAYGKHVVAGILAGLDNSVPTAVKIKVLMGLGEWDAMEEASYDGTIVDPANYSFHPGTLSTGAADPAQGADTRFPNGIYHSRIAYYTMTLPDGLGAEERPDKMRVIARTRKVNTYDAAGNFVSYIYSTNPADVFADIVRINSERLGLTFAEQMDWAAYYAARQYYAIAADIDDGVHTPLNLLANSTGAGGTLPAGTFFYRVAALDAGGTESAASNLRSVETAVNTKNQLSWDAVTGATDYRVYFGTTPTLTSYFDVGGATTSFEHNTTSGASVGSPTPVPTGSWAVTAEHLQCHRAFTTSEVLTGDALSAVMFDAASNWVRDGKQHRIILPNDTAVQKIFTIDNTTAENFKNYKVPVRQRVNQVSASFRNLFNKMKPEEASPTSAADFDLQSRVGKVEEEITLGSMDASQMRRITQWRLRDKHALPHRMIFTGQGDSANLLPGDVVGVRDKQGGDRNIYGAFSATEGVLFSSINPVVKFNGTNQYFDGVTPSGKSQGYKQVVDSVGGQPDPAWLANLSSYTVGDGAQLLVWVKIKKGSTIDEITIQLINTSTSVRHITSLRLPQTTNTFAYLATDAITRFDMPPQGEWVPIMIDLAASEGVTFNAVGGSAKGTSGEVWFSEFTYFEYPLRRYRIEEAEDSDSEAADERTLTVAEYHTTAYDINGGNA
jgi:hypothetical protein